MNPSPEVSLVIPVRNGMPYIEHTLESVFSELANGGVDAEVIVRENGSTDGTAEWLTSVEHPALRVVVAESPMSACENWTSVVAESRGRFIKLLCADDALVAGGLVRQLEVLRQHPSVRMVASRRRVITAEGRTVLRSHGLNGLVGLCSGAEAVRRAARSGTNPFGEPSGVLFDGGSLRAALPFSDANPYVIDLEMFERVLRSGSFFGLRSVDAVFRVSTTSWSAALGSAQLSDYCGWLDRVAAAPDSAVRVSDAQLGRQMARAMFHARRFITRPSVSAWMSSRREPELVGPA